MRTRSAFGSEVTRRTRRYIGTLPPNRLRKPNAFAPGGLPAYIERDDLDYQAFAGRDRTKCRS